MSRVDLTLIDPCVVLRDTRRASGSHPGGPSRLAASLAARGQPTSGSHQGRGRQVRNVVPEGNGTLAAYASVGYLGWQLLELAIEYASAGLTVFRVA